MKKIPTLFVRDPGDMSRVLPEYHLACDWVRDGEGVATLKYDGTCVMYDGTFWWARREVKADKRPPLDFQLVELDPLTGNQVGWEPIEQSSFAKFHAEALVETDSVVSQRGWQSGTYELVGPKINGNPENVDYHQLWRHAASVILANAPRDFEGLRAYLAGHAGEGIVWHHPDGRMAKIKRRDFGHRWGGGR